MKLFIHLYFFVGFLSTYGQEYPRGEIDISQVADDLYGLPDSDLNYEDLYENLIQLFADPINLNKATLEDFRFIKILSESQIDNLLKYREQNENFISVYELQAVPDFDLATLYKLAPFVTVADEQSTLNADLVRRIKKESENYFLFRYERTLESKKGFNDEPEESSRFKGSPDKLYMRFRSSNPGDFSMGFTAEKDAGEQIRWNTSARYYGADYLSYHLQLQNKGRLKNLILGDFQTQFGQGLMLGGIFGTGKGGETITTVRRSNIGMVPYTSVNEAGGMRGIGLTVQASERLTVTGFYSIAKRDASLSVNEEEADIISSFQTTGLHRNDSELAKRKIIGERNFGSVIQYRNNALDAGIMFNQTSFDAPVYRTPTAYNQFAFEGSINRNVGLYINYTFHNITFFGEVAHSLNGGYAQSAGILTSVSPKLDLSILYRKYARNFYSFYSSGFAENTNTQNENGIYWGWKYSFNRRYSIAGYADFFRFPWLRFRSYGPSTGYEWLLRLNWEPSRKVKIFLQAREESKVRNVDGSINQYQVVTGKKNNYCVSFDYSPHLMLRLKSRAQLSTYAINQLTTHGFALMQDLILDIGNLKFTMRYAIFETDDYDNRQYAYENDVWLAYSLPAYYGSGVRKMAIFEYKFGKHVSFWLRYAHVRYRHQEFIGTSVDRIDGNIRNDVKAQVTVKF